MIEDHQQFFFLASIVAAFLLGDIGSIAQIKCSFEFSLHGLALICLVLIILIIYQVFIVTKSPKKKEKATEE